MIEVRRIKPGEGHIIFMCAEELGKTHAWGPHMTSRPQDFEDALFAVNPIIGAIVALVDGKPAGSALWHRSFSTARGREVMYLEDLVVLPDYRRRGIAELLMKQLAKVAVAEGYATIYWLMMAWNSGARKFYEKLGADIESDNCYCVLSDRALGDLAK